MKQHSSIRFRLFSCVATCLLGVSPIAHAQSTTVIYALDDVWLLPDNSHPSAPAQQMTGTFEWTYDAGDFENGSGVFTEVFIPWFSLGLSELNITIETSSIEFTLNGNYHDLGVDITLFLADPLDPDLPASIDLVRSKFQIEQGIIHDGHMIDGWIVPLTDPCPADLTGDGIVDAGDLGDFITAYLAGDLLVDFTGDGIVDAGDLGSFITHYLGGC